jgi:hypothetical protein
MHQACWPSSKLMLRTNDQGCKKGQEYVCRDNITGAIDASANLYHDEEQTPGWTGACTTHRLEMLLVWSHLWSGWSRDRHKVAATAALMVFVMATQRATLAMDATAELVCHVESKLQRPVLPPLDALRPSIVRNCISAAVLSVRA